VGGQTTSKAHHTDRPHQRNLDAEVKKINIVNHTHSQTQTTLYAQIQWVTTH